MELKGCTKHNWVEHEGEGHCPKCPPIEQFVFEKAVKDWKIEQAEKENGII